MHGFQREVHWCRSVSARRGKIQLSTSAGLAAAGKLVLLVVVASLVIAFFALDLSQYASLEYLKAVHGEALSFVAENPAQSSAAYFLVYVLVTGLSLPGAAVMTIAGGAIFGFLWGLALVSFASTLGATIAMVISRTLLRDWVQHRFAAQLATINAGVERDGGFYLFGLRMVPLFPFFVINVVMGLTPLRLWTFYWVSQVGMLAGTAVFVFAGTQLAQVTSVGDILSPGLIAALSLLGLFPIIARKVLGLLSRRREAAAQAD